MVAPIPRARRDRLLLPIIYDTRADAGLRRYRPRLLRPFIYDTESDAMV